MIDLYPKIFNICFGKVVYTSNNVVYGREYGSGKCYYCTKCKAYVGTHKPRPKEALGLLADKRMRKGKMMCHELFDKKWRGKENQCKARAIAYKDLAEKLEIKQEDCHFGHFDLEMLRKAYKILSN